MALNGIELGQLIYDCRQQFSNKTPTKILAAFGTYEAARIAAAQAEATVIINYLVANAEVLPTTMVAPEHVGLVTGKGTIV